MADTFSKWNYDKILVLTKEGTTRAGIAKALQAAGFHVDFVGSANEVVDSLNSFGNGILIHDFEATEKSQGELLQQRLFRLDEYAPIIRIVLAQEITPKLLAIASDTQINARPEPGGGQMLGP